MKMNADILLAVGTLCSLTTEKKKRQSSQAPRDTSTISLSHNIAKSGYGVSTWAPRVQHMRVWLSQPPSRDKKRHPRKKSENRIAICTPQNALPQWKTATCRSKKIPDTTSQASMERTSLVSILAFFERQSCTVATSPLLAAGTRSAVAFAWETRGKSGE